MDNDKIKTVIDQINALTPDSSLEHWQENEETGNGKEYFGEFCTPANIASLKALANAHAELVDEVKRLRTALADAVRCPMGVLPDSAVGLLTTEQLLAAENRRIEGKAPAIKYTGSSCDHKRSTCDCI